MRIGGIRIEPVRDGSFRLDGGAMFGVVPRTVWEKACPADELHRITLSITPLLVQTMGRNILVDTGIGSKGSQRFNSIYAVDRTTTLAGSLKALGLEPEDIDIVVNTHLHFDHAGGNTVEKDGSLVPAFPRARYIVQRGEWEAAASPNERTRASYRAADFAPLMDAGVLELIEGDGEVAPGVTVFRTSGHNRDIQLVRIASGEETAIYLSDIIPTVAHLKLPYITGYDLFPLETLKAKKEILSHAAGSRALLVFEHDPAATMGYVMERDGELEFERVL